MNVKTILKKWIDEYLEEYFEDRCHHFINEQRHNRAESNKLLKKREAELKKNSVYFKNAISDMEVRLLRNVEESVADRTNMWAEIERLR